MVNKNVPMDVEVAAQTLFEKTEQGIDKCFAAMQSDGDANPVHHLYVALVTAAAGIETAARIMSIPSKPTVSFDEWFDNPVDRQVILAAAIALARSLIPTAKGFTFHYSPENIKAALDATAKLTGNPDTSMFTSQMVDQVNKYPVPTHIFDNSGVEAGNDNKIPTLH